MAAQKERVYTEAEKKRLERLTKVTEEMAARGYTRNDRTIDLGKANLILGIVSIPVFLIGVMLFFFASDSPDFDMGLRNSLILLVSIVVLTVVHELIHGATWSIFSENHWKDIDFGFIVRTMNPYCTCCQPLEKGQYILGALMPLVLLGIIPTVIAYITSSFVLLLIGLTMILSAGGDIMLVLKLLSFQTDAKESMIYDHPTEAGCIVFTR
ncbi:MAG: DUF3267 domain-containing protein [Oscillospiraceae bacterium]|nr:DUF3267 domain-containing protein [Oscillospiraceae bacterium]